MDEDGEMNTEAAEAIARAAAPDEAIDVTSSKTTEDIGDPAVNPFVLQNGEIRTLDGEIAGDEFAADAVNYQVLLGKIDGLLERLKLDA